VIFDVKTMWYSW